MQSSYKTLDDMDLAGKRVLVRVDFNVPMEDGAVRDNSRLRRALPTIRELMDKRARVILISHMGRPDGSVAPQFSLKPIAQTLTALLEHHVTFVPESIGPAAQAAVEKLVPGEILLLENLRFHAEEEQNDPAFVEQLAALGDVFVNDAFSVSHRAHASVVGLAKALPALAGRGLQQELEALHMALENPQKPVMAIVGGAKISSKLAILQNLLDKVDTLVIGGAMANTFLMAEGYSVGRSLCEPDLVPVAQQILRKAREKNCRIMLPDDMVVATELKPNVANRNIHPREIDEDEMILDVGPNSVVDIEEAMDDSKTLLWNGPMGAFEVPPFDQATATLAARAAGQTKVGKLVSVAGGGDTLAALAGYRKDFTYVSAAGGAFLEWLEGKVLPGIEALQA